MREGEKWDCNKCTALDKIARGCEGSRKYQPGSVEHYGCPQRLTLEPSFSTSVQLWSRWKMFGYPFAGGWAEQPARVFDVIEALERESTYLDNQRIERAKNGKSQ